MNDIKSLLSEGNGRQRALIEESKGLVEKWKRSGLLEGLTDEYEVSSTAILLENQAKQLVSEASRTGTAEGSEEWAGVALPLVRRIFSEIAAKDFVSVQPMNLPSGLVFYLDFKYGSAQAGFQTGAGKDSQTDSVFGITNDSGDAREGLYGAGRFGYSINEVSSSALATGSVLNGFYNTGQAALSDFNFDSEFSASVYAGKTGDVQTITVGSASLKNNPAGTAFDPEGVRAFTIAGTGIVTYYPAFTRVNSTNSQVTFVVSGSSGSIQGATDVVVTYHNQPTDITRGDFEEAGPHQNPVSDIGIPEINVELRSEPIVAKTRKLKAIWSPEFAQDLNAYHSIDAEAELTSMLSEYISQEIDLEILDMLIANATTTEYWSTTVGKVYNSGTGTFEADANLSAQAFNQGTWFQTFGTKVQKVSNAIHTKTMRGGANFLVCSPTVATILESIPGYAGDTDGSTMGTTPFAFGVQKVGTLNSRFSVYKNPYMQENTVLMGYRGTQFLETGAVYSPYIPLLMTPLVYDPENFTPRKGVMTRYAKTITRPEFYGKIYVEGLNNL